MMQLPITISLAPTIALAIYIYQKDRHDREPMWLLIKLFSLGAVIVIPVYFTEKLLASFNLFQGLLSAAYTAFIIAGLTEESFKWLVVTRVACRNRNYDEKLDGIVYSVFSALGFATVENMLYVLGGASSLWYTGITRGIFAVPAHMLFGVTMGYYLSLSRFAETDYKRLVYLRKSLYIPVVLHGIYDFILMSDFSFLMILFAIFVLYLWRINLVRLNEYVSESREKNGP